MSHPGAVLFLNAGSIENCDQANSGDIARLATNTRFFALFNIIDTLLIEERDK